MEPAYCRPQPLHTTDDASAGRAGPLLPLALQKSGHPRLPDEPQIRQRGFAERVLRSVPGLLLHDVGAGRRIECDETVPVEPFLLRQTNLDSFPIYVYEYVPNELIRLSKRK